MKKTLVFYFILLGSFLFAQQSKIDSLKKKLSKSLSDKDRVKVLSKLNDLLLENNDIETEKNALKFIELSKKIKDKSFQIKSLNEYGTILAYKGDYKKSIIYIKKAIDLSDNLKNVEQSISCRDNLCGVYFDLQKNDSCYITIKEAIELSKKYKFYNLNQKIYKWLGMYYYTLEKEQKAIENYLIASKYANKNNDYSALSDIHMRLAWIFIDRKDYILSKKYIFSGIKIINEKKSRDDLKLAFFYRTLGYVYNNEKKLDSSLYYKKKYFDGIKYLKNNKYLYDAYLNLADVYLKLDDFENAEKFADLSIVKADDGYVVSSYSILTEMYIKKEDNINADKYFNRIINDTLNLPNYLKQELYETYIKYYKWKKDYRNVAKYQSFLLKRNDSLYRIDYAKKTKNLEIEYQTEKKEKENLQLKQENIQKELTIEKQTRDKLVLAIALIGLLIISSIIYWFYKKAKKQKELTEIQKNEIEKQKETIENLQKFLHHENKNNLSRISAFIDVAKNEITDQKIISKLNETQGRLQSIYEVHSQLYLSENLSNINFKNYIDKLVKSVQHTHDKNQVEIINNISENLKISTEIIFSLGLIVNELITNSFKHAFSSKKNPQIFIDLKQVNNKYVLEFLDNGNGLPQNFDIKNLNSYGFELIKILTKELNGTLKMENINGLQINIEF